MNIKSALFKDAYMRGTTLIHAKRHALNNLNAVLRKLDRQLRFLILLNRFSAGAGSLY